MKKSAKVIRLKDYRPPGFKIAKVNMQMNLHKERTTVNTELHVKHNTQSEIFLDGVGLELLEIGMDRKPLKKGRDYELSDEGILLKKAPKEFKLRTKVAIRPQENNSLLGLYVSGGIICTKSETEGFRRITFFPDRPDVLARYTVALKAKADEFPVLLSNGNLRSSRKFKNGMHKAVWDDPVRKPCYLFAAVAGRFDVVRDSFKTKSGRRVKLGIYVDPGKGKMATHAMECLKRAMRWDEKAYGCEYDLDYMNIVATRDLFAAACEAKGLNLFNDRYVLVDDFTATEADYRLVDDVIAHEYFHNWSGNRVTIRDWFNLALKEGFTVYRTQEYLYGNYDRECRRVQDARTMENSQFKEDASALSRPVRPAEYVNARDVYGDTAYEKGAEVFRVMEQLAGRENFVKGAISFFKKYDGQAVTCDEFMGELFKDTSRVSLWFDRAGTPVVKVLEKYDGEGSAYRLNLSHNMGEGFVIPLRIALISGGRVREERIVLDHPYKTFTFDKVKSRPLLSLNRFFSAPVIIEHHYSGEELLELVRCETDGYVKANALKQYILRNAGRKREGDIAAAMQHILEDDGIGGEMKALLLELPGVMEFYDGGVKDFAKIIRLREGLKRAVAGKLEKVFKAYAADASCVKALRNAALLYLATLDGYKKLLTEAYRKADNMTDKQAAFSIIVQRYPGAAPAVVRDFYETYKEHDLAVNKWFAIQSEAMELEEVQKLLSHPSFSFRTPNKVFAVLGAFTRNYQAFHKPDGSGYRFLADNIIKIERDNPIVADILLDRLILLDGLPERQWRRMKEALESVRDGVKAASMIDKINKKLTSGA